GCGVQRSGSMRIVFRGQVFEAELTDLARRNKLDFHVAGDEAELLRALPGAGYDVLLRAGVPPGVTMTYAATVHGPAVAEHAVALVLALVRQLPRALAAQPAAVWNAPAMIGTLRSL